ncbi:MAG: multiheme c-type cytochrome [Terriglobia bacterium]
MRRPSGAMRVGARFLPCSLLGLATLSGGFLLSGDAVATAPSPQTQPAKARSFQYTGPGSCSSTSCHGSVRPKQETGIAQNEYSIWVVQDKHAKAFEVLSNPVSVRIARILGLPRADTASRCLACHALHVPAAQQAKTFDPSDGVSCESCHGPAAGWLGPHTTRDWSHEKSVELGMYDTKDLIKRTEKCLTCHLGTEGKFVDHELIAAGHPDLVFELDSFSAVMPRHWKQPLEEDPWRGVRAWGTGQAVQLREALKHLARRARGPVWPEYAELQCFACHHDLTGPERSWRQERGYSGRRAGNPPWNASRYAAFRHLVHSLDPDAGRQMDTDLSALAELMSRLEVDRNTVAARASGAAQTADRLAHRISQLPFDGPMTLRLLRRITADADAIAGEGERAAEQAAMALDSLFIAYTRNARVGNAEEVRVAINGLFRQLESPSGYNPKRFARQMRSVSALLRSSRGGADD